MPCVSRCRSGSPRPISTNKIALTEARDTLLGASDSQQWGAVLDAAASNKMLMTCGEIDALWRTAEALVRSGDEARALGGLSLHS